MFVSNSYADFEMKQIKARGLKTVCANIVRLLNKASTDNLKTFSYSTQLNIKFILLIDMKTPTSCKEVFKVVGISIFIGRMNMFSSDEHGKVSYYLGSHFKG